MKNGERGFAFVYAGMFSKILPSGYIRRLLPLVGRHGSDRASNSSPHRLLRVPPRTLCAPFKGNVVHYSKVSRWFKRLESGDTTFGDRPRSGRPYTVDDEALQNTLNAKPNATTRKSATTLGETQGERGGRRGLDGRIPVPFKRKWDPSRPPELSTGGTTGLVLNHDLFHGPLPLAERSGGPRLPDVPKGRQHSEFGVDVIPVSFTSSFPLLNMRCAELLMDFRTLQLCGSLSVLVVQDFLTYPKVVSIQVMQDSTMEFPAVTVCSFNVLSRSAVEKEKGILSPRMVALLDSEKTIQGKYYGRYFEQFGVDVIPVSFTSSFPLLNMRCAELLMDFRTLQLCGSLVMQDSTMEFPAVTVCSFNVLSRSAVEKEKGILSPRMVALLDSEKTIQGEFYGKKFNPGNSDFCNEYHFMNPAASSDPSALTVKEVEDLCAQLKTNPGSNATKIDGIRVTPSALNRTCDGVDVTNVERTFEEIGDDWKSQFSSQFRGVLKPIERHRDVWYLNPCFLGEWVGE
ncbi:unnamed protein product [Darwinula stevensoni]|uniref:Uncharacterized protein n=1 Tax=Darwinula stevensoni TaxID=69355 RepID=A0A7R9A9G8_9CRUS|nr:unnamed protein product [Darwinula stevensoni]CAG0897375.1 unnamed protein product [Darwinula stevensoni]